jgi:hypothetical protein
VPDLAVTDWSAWHAAYDDPRSPLAHRLDVVKRRLGDALDALDASGCVRPSILSLCAGEGRDVVQVLGGRAASPVGRVLLVERDPALAAHAAASAAAAQLTALEVRCADAGLLASFEDVLPVDVLLLCGVFGNLTPSAVPTVVSAVPSLVAPGGFVLWTRGGSAPDQRPEVRRRFSEAGMEEISFDGAPAPFGVGLHRRASGDRAPLPDRLFTFAAGEEGPPGPADCRRDGP